MTFQEWKAQNAADITDMYFEFLADTNQTADDCSIIVFAEHLYTQTEHSPIYLSTCITLEGRQ